MEFTSSDLREFDKWISQQLDQKKTWEEIETLCVPEEKFAEALEALVDEEMWPEELSLSQWKSHVREYKKSHPEVVISKTQKIIGIDENGPYNEFLVPHGVSSTWEQYRESLGDMMGPASVINIERSCQWIMNHLKNNTVDFGAVKGLVTGSVQSGKTANMAGLVSMAADREWNFFIVLSGTIDNLRKQTRDRFKRDLCDSEGIRWQVLDFTGEDKKLRPETLNLNALGKRSFSKRYLTVCLKNKRRLENLIDWLYEDKKITQKLRIVVIDDEADQASINTEEITLEEEQERCAINQLIVNLVNGRKSDGSVPEAKFQAMNYLAYTATPYANVLNEAPGESLYPKDFICTLPESSEYFGAKVIFGNDEQGCLGLGIVRNISAADEKELKKLHKGMTLSLPPSLKEALAWFLCASAVIRLRPHRKKKSISMLLHTTSVQQQHFNVYEAIRGWLTRYNEVLEQCESIYEEEKTRVTAQDLREANPNYGFIDDVSDEFPDFAVIEHEISMMLNEIQNILLDDDRQLRYGEGIHLCVDNCRANKEAEEGTALRIVYPSDAQLATMDRDPVFIVIGGNTLSRGLTIEGLVSSYFSRNSNQADTLMQMARWFGYRKGFELLQRIWMTSGVLKKFEALSKIDMDMKEEIERFMERGISPAQFGLRIRNIPEIKNFRITAKKKSQQAEYDDFDFSGDSYEITDFENGKMLKGHIETTEEFIKSISRDTSYVRSTRSKAYVWRGIDFERIKKDFLTKYIISEYSTSLRVNLPIFCQWMEKMNEEGKYKKWNLAVMDGESQEEAWNPIESVTVGHIERTRKRDVEHIDIGSLRSGRDVLADIQEEILTDRQKEVLNEALKSGKELVSKRAKLGLEDTPLLLIYSIKRNGGTETKRRIRMDADYNIIGISIIVSGDGIGGNHANSIRIKLS